MATKKTKAPKGETKTVEVPKTSENLEKARAVREARAANDIFKFVKQPGESDKKLPKQAQGIVNILEAAGEDGLTRSKLCEAMTEVIETRQPIGRILTYYTKRLVEAGHVAVYALPADNQAEPEEVAE